MRISDWSSDVCSSDLLLPIIRYSVTWWNTLHRAQSIGLTGSTIDSAILWPLFWTLPGATLFFAGLVLMRMRAMVAAQRVEARLRRLAVWPTGAASPPPMRSGEHESDSQSLMRTPYDPLWFEQ